jgi:hypothetical protein
MAMKLYNTLPSGVRALDKRKFEAVIRRCLLDRPLYSLREAFEEPLRLKNFN